MNRDTLNDAVEAAKRFIALAESVDTDEWSVRGTHASGAVKQASMDLTRALTEMGKPG